MLTNSTGVAVWRSSHESFGKAAVDPASTVTFNVRFPGQYFDAETGLHDNRFRMYAPDLGRYVLPDPIGQSGSTNAYEYARLAPTVGIDPYGLTPIYPDGWNVPPQSSVPPAPSPTAGYPPSASGSASSCEERADQNFRNCTFGAALTFAVPGGVTAVACGFGGRRIGVPLGTCAHLTHAVEKLTGPVGAAMYGLCLAAYQQDLDRCKQSCNQDDVP